MNIEAIKKLWLLAVFFFTYQFVLRLSPGVLIDEIMIKYHVNASTFGLITSSYYAGYAGMQIPVGIMIDKFGVKTVLMLGSLFCILGSVPLLVSDHWVAALVGRALIGIGSCAGVLAAIAAVKLNFSKSQLPRMLGITVMISLLGAIYGKSINRYFLEKFGYEKSILFSVFPAIIIIVGLLFFVNEKEVKAERKKYSLWLSLRELTHNSKFLIISIAGALLVGPLAAFADVYGEHYLINVYNISKIRAGYLTASAIYIGMAVGAPLLAQIASRYKCNYYINIFCGFGMSVVFYLILNKYILSYSMLFFSMLMIGVMCAYQVVVFSIVSEIISEKVVGLALAIVNTANMLAGMLFNFTIGNLLDCYWTGEVSYGIRQYSDIAYSEALFILPVSLAIGALIFFFARPSRGVC